MTTLTRGLCITELGYGNEGEAAGAHRVDDLGQRVHGMGVIVVEQHDAAGVWRRARDAGLDLAGARHERVVAVVRPECEPVSAATERAQRVERDVAIRWAVVARQMLARDLAQQRMALDRVVGGVAIAL